MDSNDGSEYYPTPYKGQHLASLNNLIEKVYGRDVSPVRAQLHSPVEEISESTARYYKRKSVQSCMVALECIAPGQSGALFELVSSQQNTNSIEKVLVSLGGQNDNARILSTVLDVPNLTEESQKKSLKKLKMFGISL